MKNFSNTIKVLAFLYCLVSYGNAQERVVAAVNSPKALALDSEFENIKTLLRSQESELTIMNKDAQKMNSVEKKALEKTIDSLSDRYFEVRKTYANEI